MMSAPSAISRLACASACSGARNCPPSEKESGVTFKTPMTAGVGPDTSACSAGWRAGIAANEVGLDLVAIMRSLCAVAASESRWRQGLRPLGARRAVLANYLISNLGLQLARLRDQLLDRFFRRQHADELLLDVDVPHVLRKARWIAQGELANRGDAGGAHQPDLRLAHAGNTHVVGRVRPFQELLLADAGPGRERLAPFHGAGSFEERFGGANAKRFELGRGEGSHAFKLAE